MKHPPLSAHVIVSIPAIFFMVMFKLWPNVWLATIIPSFPWAMTLALVLYFLVAALVFVIWLVTVGWTRR